MSVYFDLTLERAFDYMPVQRGKIPDEPEEKIMSQGRRKPTVNSYRKSTTASVREQKC